MKSAYDSAGGGIKEWSQEQWQEYKHLLQCNEHRGYIDGRKIILHYKCIHNKLNAAQTAVTNVLGNIKQAFSDKLEAAKSVVTEHWTKSRSI